MYPSPSRTPTNSKMASSYFTSVSGAYILSPTQNVKNPLSDFGGERSPKVIILNFLMFQTLFMARSTNQASFLAVNAKHGLVEMIHIGVSISYISAEKFWEHDKPPPAGVHISTNINIIGVEPRDEKLSVPFVVTIGYTPSVAQISLKGHAIVSGDKGELDRLHDDYKKQRSPPSVLLQTITNASLIEATILSRTLNIPPPIPLPSMPQPQKPEKERPSYVG